MGDNVKTIMMLIIMAAAAVVVLMEVVIPRVTEHAQTNNDTCLWRTTSAIFVSICSCNLCPGRPRDWREMSRDNEKIKSHASHDREYTKVCLLFFF